MAQPNFQHHEHWSDFPQYSYSIFNKHWVHQRFCDIRVNTQTNTQVAKFRLVPSMGQKQFQYGYEASFLRKLKKQKALFFKVKSNNYLKMHYDHGVLHQGNYKWNLYGSIKGKGTLESTSIRAGAHFIANKFQTDNRLKYQIGSTKALTWYNRSLYDSGRCKLGFLGAFCLKNGFLLKNDCLFGYNINTNSSAFVRLQTCNFRKYAQDLKNWKGLFDITYLDFIFSKQRVNYGIELAYSFKEKQISDISIAGQYENAKNNHLYKAKVSLSSSISLLWKFKTNMIGEDATHSIGLFSSSILKGHAIRIGLQNEFNI